MRSRPMGPASQPIGLGTWDLRERTCVRMVEHALRLGYRHIDTAQMYENERDVVDGMRASGIKRDEVFSHLGDLAHAFLAARS